MEEEPRVRTLWNANDVDEMTFEDFMAILEKRAGDPGYYDNRLFIRCIREIRRPLWRRLLRL